MSYCTSPHLCRLIVVSTNFILFPSSLIVVSNSLSTLPSVNEGDLSKCYLSDTHINK